MTLAVPGASLTLDPYLGNLRDLRFRAGARWLVPLHSAPWLDEPAVRADPAIAPVERNLSGDFFCAPFGASAGVPVHGWSANSAWSVVQLVQSGTAAVAGLVLDRVVQGARLEKELLLKRDVPLLYQSHIVTGGTGTLPVAHHPMLRPGPEARLSFSPKQLALTGDIPLEPGRNWLKYPAQSSDLADFPGANGPVDLHRYPARPGHEDFVTLVEVPGRRLGWTAVLRAEDVVFVLKDPAVLPVTMLWYSNGGRDYAPWNGRHLGVLGIEDGCAPGAGQGEGAVLQARGVATHLDLHPDRTHVIRHVIGVVPRPAGWGRVVDIRQDGDRLLIEGDSGAPVVLPFEPEFLSGPPA
ncbi:hypothetical protein [Actibacterium sp. D379-3]